MRLTLLLQNVLQTLFSQLLVFAKKTDFISQRLILLTQSGYLAEIRCSAGPVPLGFERLLHVGGLREVAQALVVGRVAVEGRFGGVGDVVRRHEF